MTTKIEHVLKGWEIKYGYLSLNPTERELFSPVKDEHFTLNLLGEELRNRKIDAERRIYVSKEPLRDLEVGDTLIFYRDEKGNYIVERKK